MLTRLLDTGEYGLVASALVVFTVLGMAAGLGLPVAITRAHFIDLDHRTGADAARSLVWVTALAALGVGVVAELTGPLWSEMFADVSYGGPLRLAVVAAVGFAILQGAQSVLRAEQRPRPYVTSAILATAAAQLLGLGGAVLGDAEGYLAGVAIGVGIGAAFAVGAAGAWRPPPLDAKLVRANLAIGIPTIPHSIALFVLSAGDRVVVERLEGLAEVARFHVAYLVGSLPILLSMAVNNAWGPEIYGAEPERRWGLLASTASAVMRVGALAAGAIALAAPIGLRVAAPGSYELDGLGDVSAIVAVSVLPYVWYLANSHVLVWTGRTASLAAITPIVAAVNIGLNFWLVDAHGIVGAAIATLVSYLALAVLITPAARRLERVRWLWRSVAELALLAGAFAALALALPEDGLWLLVRGVLALALAGLAVRAVTSVSAGAPRPGA